MITKFFLMTLVFLIMKKMKQKVKEAVVLNLIPKNLKISHIHQLISVQEISPGTKIVVKLKVQIYRAKILRTNSNQMRICDVKGIIYELIKIYNHFSNYKNYLKRWLC